MTQVITDDLLEDHLRCHSKPYLRFHGQPGQMTAYSNLCVQLDAHNRAKALAWLMAKSKTEAVKCCNGLPLNDLATGDAIILDAVGRAQGLQSNFHALQRVSGVSDLGPFFYQPIRIFRHRQPTSAFRLLLAFDAMILSHLQGLTPKHGVLICGPLFKHVRVPLEAHLDALATVLRRLQLQLANVEEPPLALNPHCELCEFQQVCRAKAEAADNLTILKGMTLKEMARHNSKGIFTVKQLSYTFRSRRHAKRQSPRFPHHFSLQARAIRENKVHVHGDPNLTLSQTQVYLDIEGLPDRGFYYLIGALVVCGQSQVYHRFWADEESQQAAIFAELAELESATNNAQLFHYGNYDINAVRRMLPYMPASYQRPLRAMLVNSTNILSIVSSHVYFPTASNGLKDIAGFLGFRWSSDEASGLQSIVWREQWEGARNEVLKMKLVEYNRDDCLALRVVTEFIASIRNREAEGGTRYWEPDTIVHTGELISAVPGKHRFRRAHFFLPDLEFVNRHAYFDHRDTVYPRSRQSARVTKPHHKPKRRRPAKINKRIELRCKRCPHCNSRRLSEGKVFSTRIIDLKFLASGVKKWVTTYSAYEYRCDKCRKTFKSPDYPDWKSAYGDGLMTWAIYQNVALGQNMSKVEQGLRDVFKLNIPQPTMYRFKGLMARRYEPTKETTFAELLRGPSLSVDETEARLRNEKAHVWVFAGRSGAYYEYRESRNGQFLIERLSGFDGVLVSDFFTAYDAVKNPQQKCLIHLIRDMNEDVKASPFDTELRDIVQAFALVIRPIIETVDRYGLTKSRLQKHKIKAMEFVEKIAGDRVLSEAARKYQSRIEKYGDRLFTFLDYDGVPWHNNDAEHAIKAFARYRRFADGTFTKQSVSDYLTLLSIVQTCEYQGKKILQVLLNKEVKFTFGRPYSAHAGTA